MSKTFIIAEIGVNHNGSMELARKSIIAAKASGADCVKFQFFNSDKLTIKNLKKASYQKVKKKETQSSMLQKLQLNFEQLNKLKKIAKRKKLKFMVSIFDSKDIAKCKKLNDGYFKIPSGEITNLIMLKEISKHNCKVILSTGMSSDKDIKKALNALKIIKKKLFLLQCTSEYPAKLTGLNLNVLKNFKKKYQCELGFSDHSLSLIAGSIAVSLGAKIVEKHFTLNNQLNGPDHKASLNPQNFKKYVQYIRDTEQMLGKKEKIASKEEIKNSEVVRKFLVAANPIQKGEIFTFKNLTSKRTGKKGTCVSKYAFILGKKAKKNYQIDETI